MLEGRALSEPAFDGFAGKVVPYLNVMTRIDGHPHDDLLTEKGYSGHPTLAFMDAKGEIVGRPRDRTVENFESTLTAIHDLAKLEAREKDGEKGLEYERFILEYRVSKLRGAKLAARGKSLRGLDEKRQARVDAIVLGVEVDDLVLQSMGGGEALIAAGRRMKAILDGGRCPDMEASANAWSVLARYGEQIGDAALLERCAAGLRKHFPKEEQMTSWAASLEKKAKAIRSK